MKAQIPWTRVFAEGVAIVVSILLAFGIQASWETSQARGEERRALEALERDFTANRDTLVALVDLHQELMADLFDFYGTPLEELQARPDPAALADSVMNAFIMQITYDPTVGSLETLLRGGRIGFIQSAELENALWLWQRQLIDSQEEAALLIETVNESMKTAARLGIYDVRDPSVIHPDAAEILWRSDEMAAQAAVIDLWRNVYLGELMGLLELTDTVLALLDD